MSHRRHDLTALEAGLTAKHLKTRTEERPRSDLKIDPGMGRSKARS